MIKIDSKSQVTGLNRAVRELNKLDKGIVKQLRTDLKGELTGDAKDLAAEVSGPAPLSGFNHKGRTRWNGARGSVSVTPSRIRKGKDVHPIVTLRLTGKGSTSGFDIAEMAGTRNLRYSKNRDAGSKFVNNLNAVAPFKFKGGRFGYGFFLRKRKGIEKKAIKVIDKFARKFNRMVSR